MCVSLSLAGAGERGSDRDRDRVIKREQHGAAETEGSVHVRGVPVCGAGGGQERHAGGHQEMLQVGHKTDTHTHTHTDDQPQNTPRQTLTNERVRCGGGEAVCLWGAY